MGMKSNSVFLSELKEINPDVCLLEPYRGAKKKINCRCCLCGNEWRATPDDLLHGCGCPECAKARLAKKYRKEHEQFVREVEHVLPSVEILGQYVNNRTRVHCKCKECGNEWDVTPNSLLRGHGCAKCANVSRRSDAEFKEDLSRVNPDIVALERYSSLHHKIRFKCLRCGHTWSAEPSSILGQRTGCPRCAKSGTSFMEQFLLISLKLALGEDAVVSRDCVAIGQELDIFIPSKKFAIEPGSWHFHSRKLESDKSKRSLCREKGIRLLTIYDSCPLENPPFPQDCLIYPFDFNQDENHATLRVIVDMILERIHIQKQFDESHWETIEYEAKSKSGVMTEADFADRLKRISPDIKLAGNYVSYDTKVDCVCEKCGHHWSARPNTLLRGQGCPNCAGNIRRTNEEFVNELHAINPNITPLEEYVNNKTRILCRCENCGLTWRVSPYSLLLQRTSCPRCSGCYSMSSVEFVEQMKLKQPEIIPLGCFKNSKTMILFRCNVCGAEWNGLPGTVLKNGCKNCNRRSAARKNARSNDDFIAALAILHPSIRVLSPYISRKRKVLCECTKCSNRWHVSADSLLQGHGCPNCANESIELAKRRKTLCVETGTVFDDRLSAAKWAGVSKSAIGNAVKRGGTSAGYHWKDA